MYNISVKNGKKIYLPILDIGSEEYSYFTIKRKPNPKVENKLYISY